MAESFEITDAMRAMIGLESEPWSYELTTTSVRAFARGVGITDPVYFDVEAATCAGYESLPAPPTYLGTAVFSPAESHPYLPGAPGALPDLGHGLDGLLDGGTEIVYERTPVAGDALTATVKITELETKTSPTLGVMLVMTTETTYRTRTGETIARECGTAIFY